MEIRSVVSIAIVAILSDWATHVEGGCNWPTAFASTTWHDNTHGDVVFAATTMTGWSFTVSGTTVGNWECLDTQDFATDGVLLLKATDTFFSLGKTWVTYLCLQMTQITDASYYYVQQHAEQPNANNERVNLQEGGTTLTTRAQVCDTSVTLPATDFHVIINSADVSTAKQFCASPLLAQMDYVHTDGSGTVTCDTSSDNWDVCTDRQVMTFDYSTCPTKYIPLASGSSVNCVYTTLSTYHYQVVYDPSSAEAYRFSCFVVAGDGLTASADFGACRSGQTPSTLVTSNGAKYTMTPFVTCPFSVSTTTTTTTTTVTTTTVTGSGATNTAAAGSSAEGDSGGGGGGTSILPLIAGAVVGILALIALAILIYCCCFRKRKNTVETDDPEKRPPTAPVSDVTENSNNNKLKVEDVDNATIVNPALLLSTPRGNLLTPISKVRPGALAQNGTAGAPTQNGTAGAPTQNGTAGAPTQNGTAGAPTQNGTAGKIPPIHGGGKL